MARPALTVALVLASPALVDGFFRTLQAQFLEVFHPLLITARLYRRS